MVKFDGQKLKFVYCHADAWFYYRLVNYYYCYLSTTICFIRLRFQIVRNGQIIVRK